jgi:DNA-binding response OmpR family regulator
MKRILVVEDDPRLCDVMRDFLIEDGYEVKTAHDGNQALDRLRETPADLMIVDINMPGLGGASLIRLLRTQPEWRQFAGLPIIVMSALWDILSFDLEIQAGFAKPVPYEEVQAKVRELIGPP